jgi:hypothetical protein
VARAELSDWPEATRAATFSMMPCSLVLWHCVPEIVMAS